MFITPILQNSELPNGCEATSLAMVLNYMGYDVTKEAVADTYLPTQDFYFINSIRYGGDPEQVYVGNSHENGFYCFTKPVVAANKYLDSVDSAKRAYDITGASIRELKKYANQKIPTII